MGIAVMALAFTVGPRRGDGVGLHGRTSAKLGGWCGGIAMRLGRGFFTGAWDCGGSWIAGGGCGGGGIWDWKGQERVRVPAVVRVPRIGRARNSESAGD